MRSLDRALRATGQAQRALMAVETASCRLAPRRVNIRRVGRTRPRLRIGFVQGRGAKAGPVEVRFRQG